MIWSYSGSRMFRRCQRQWYFKQFLASATANDPIRREAYVLSTLQTIAAWRGNLIDHVISERIMPAVKWGWQINLVKVLEYARSVFDEQLAFARAHRVREQGMTKTQAGDAFASLFPVEYGQGVSEDEENKAWLEVEHALTNLFEMRELLVLLGGADDLLPQRPLTFSVHQVKARAVPDLIAFFEGDPPLLVDWKVHAFGVHDYRLQLACYSIALKRSKPHKDFPVSLRNYAPTDARLLEIQLLTNQQREYGLTDSDIERVDSYICETAVQMLLALGNDETSQLKPSDFSATSYPGVCQRCVFRSLCWEESIWEEQKQEPEWKQMSFL